MSAPDKLLIRYAQDDDRFGLMGQYGSGNQFLAFGTGAYPSDWWSGSRSPEYLRNHWAEHKRWYAVLHRFDSTGNHQGPEAHCGGTTAQGEADAWKQVSHDLENLVASLGGHRLGDIEVKLFGIELDGYFFGLVYSCENPEGLDDPEATHEYVMLEPNDIMFHPPWDSGEYST